MLSVMTKLWSTKLVGPKILVMFSVKLSSFPEFSSIVQFLQDQNKLAPYYNSAKAE